MFEEQLAKLTRTHYQEHLAAYMAALAPAYDTKVNLVLPRRFDISSVVGGTVGISQTTLPAFAITALEKQLAATDDDVWSYLYSGQLAGMVMAPNAEIVESIARRYAGTFEMFLNDHRRAPVKAAVDENALPFRLKSMGFIRTEFFGAATLDAVEPEKTPEIWIDGFRTDFFWETIEAGPGQHE